MTAHAVVSREEWIATRKSLLEREKEQTALRDRLSAERRALPWVEITKTYAFDTVDGRKTLADLFGNCSQLIVQHFMFAPDWEEGCVGCSFGADHANAAYQHLTYHDVAYVAVARAPIAKLEAYRKRIGWDFPFASSGDSDFNYDFNVSFTPEQNAAGKVLYNFEMIENEMTDLPGDNVFIKDADGRIYHTYSQFARGGEEVMSAYMLLDITPNGRNETGPNYGLMDWVRRHDQYDDAASSCCSGQRKQGAA